MREINVTEIENTVKDLCIRANRFLPKSLADCISCAEKKEKSPTGREVLSDLVRNLQAAETENLAICQDTGMAVIFLDVGQEVHFVGGSLAEAINKGVARGYTEGYLRCSIVADPLERVNTGDNTPAVVHTRIVDGDKVDISVCPKGFGSENMSAVKMFTPSASIEDIENFAVETASKAGSNPCPPMVIGVGLGGDFEYCAYLAKKALCRDVAVKNPKKLYADMEARILEKINRLGIGPQGFGGTVTALSVAIEQAPTHIAGLPAAVNIGCHVTRHAHAVL
ncbi:MAG: fumarate hydratase [Ruminococcus sp.]|nr:fumarate hydratase [Ruminococcus sp.]MCM1381123.1 fumarate hydratase [Muribaculaceae bacterium]MCM1478086.1 fumarate hydratase [Muribaculaceae bacterium]